MKTSTKFALMTACLSLAVCCISSTHAGTFGIGANEFTIDFVTIGDPNNADDTAGNPNPAGNVGYIYRIGQYEISEGMIDKANAQSSADGDPLVGRRPIFTVAWGKQSAAPGLRMGKSLLAEGHNHPSAALFG